MNKDKKLRLVLFDIDGTLINAGALSAHAFVHCASKVLNKTVTVEDCKSINPHGQTELNLVTQVLELHMTPNPEDVDAKIRAKRIDDLRTQFFSIHPICVNEEVKKGSFTSVECPGVIDLVNRICNSQEELKEKGIHFGLLTGNSEANSFTKLKAAGLNTEFLNSQVSIFGDMFLVRRDLVPAVWAKAKSLEGYEFGPENTIIIGDTPMDIDCAKVHGAKAFAVATGAYNTETLEKLNPEYIMENFLDQETFLSIITTF